MVLYILTTDTDAILPELQRKQWLCKFGLFISAHVQFFNRYEYKLNVKNFNLSANIGALSYNFKYVDRNNLRGNYGIRAPHSSDTEFGSTITINYTWNIFKNVSHTCQVDIENTTKFSFNKYLNTQLYLYPRFDDTYYKDGKSEFFQFKELWSLAFNYSF